MDLASATKIASIVTPIVIAGGFGFAFRQLQSIRNSRMAQIVLSLAERWESSEMHESRCKVSQAGKNLKAEIDKAAKENSPELCGLVGVGNFFDFLGAIVKEGYLSCRTAYNLYWRAEQHYYTLYQPILEAPEYKNFLEYFQILHRLFENERTERHKERPRPAA